MCVVDRGAECYTNSTRFESRVRNGCKIVRPFLGDNGDRLSSASIIKMVTTSSLNSWPRSVTIRPAIEKKKLISCHLESRTDNSTRNKTRETNYVSRIYYEHSPTGRV